MIRLLRRVKFPRHWPERGVSVDFENLHAVPRLSPTPYAFDNLPAGDTFTIKEALHVGRAQWSQVYSGSLASASLGVQDDVVLKLYSSAFFPYIDVDVPGDRASLPEEISENSFRYTDELMAWAEVHAYGRLARLQGVVVPRFIDAFVVRSPATNEETLAVAMSRVHGRSLLDKCRALGNNVNGDTRWYPLAMEVFRNAYAIHAHGIIGLDIRLPNVLVVDKHPLESSTQAPSVMLFDFAFSRPSAFCSAESDATHRVNLVVRQDCVHLGYLLGDLCAPDEDKRYSERGLLTGNQRRWNFLTWARERHPQEPWVVGWAAAGRFDIFDPDIGKRLGLRA